MAWCFKSIKGSWQKRTSRQVRASFPIQVVKSSHTPMHFALLTAGFFSISSRSVSILFEGILFIPHHFFEERSIELNLM